jgi:DNA-binding response OmpR family regulator
VQDPQHDGSGRAARPRRHGRRPHGRLDRLGRRRRHPVTAGPAEVDARIRLAVGRQSAEQTTSRIQTSGITIDESSYSAKVHGKPLDLTYKEFQLLHFFATHPSRVFTREQLLSEVWGYDYFGGTRTVDVHVRRLRAKLGDLEQLIGTVRNVGYRFNVYEDDQASTSAR